LEIIFPVIAIDGRLFQCSLEKTGKISISETASATLLWRNALPPLSETIIDLQTPSSLAGFAKQSFLAADAFLTSYYTLVQETLAQIKERERREFKFADNTPLRHPK
jgi:hypothetical protein